MHRTDHGTEFFGQKGLKNKPVRCQTPASGEDVLISNFGRFCEKIDHKGRSLATGDDLMLDRDGLLRLAVQEI
jgi:hypothetical protein